MTWCRLWENWWTSTQPSLTGTFKENNKEGETIPDTEKVDICPLCVTYICMVSILLWSTKIWKFYSVPVSPSFCFSLRQLTSTVYRYSVGQSTEGRQIWGVRITGDVRHAPPLLMPSVKLVANIHGDEKVGRELLIGLARWDQGLQKTFKKWVLLSSKDMSSRYLCDAYDNDEQIKMLVDSTDIHLVPSINPDGCEAGTRHNVNDKAHRDF